MSTRISFRLVSAGLLALFMMVSCASAAPRARVYVRVGPPAPLVEARIVAPGPGYVWIAGFHRWDGRAYMWEPGHWVMPPRPRARWVPARWVHDRRHGWYIVDGHWRG